MKKTFNLILLFVLSFTAFVNAQSARPEVGKYCNVYVNNENLQITTLRLGKPENNEVLFEIFGIDHPFDKKILKAKLNENGRNLEHIIQYEGKDWTIAIKQTDSYGDNFTVFLPNKGKKLSEFRIQYSKELSNQCTPEFLLTAFLEQKQ